MALPSAAVALALFAAGIAAHSQLFKHGEWERWSPRIALVHAVVPSVAFVWLLVMARSSVVGAVSAVLACGTAYYAGLFGSMVFYRLLWHPLRQFPGPTGAKVSSFWALSHVLPKFHFHEELIDLHKTYGDFVRIRPREISINHPDAVKDVHGPFSKCRKGPFYDLNYPSRSLQMTRDKQFHAQRRKVWDRGFSTKALRDYEPRLLQHCIDLTYNIKATLGKPTNATRLCQFFGFDVMGDLIFGKSFDMLKTGTAHFILGQMDGMKPLVGTLVCVPWLFILFQNLPVVSGKREEWIQWCGKQVEERKNLNPEHRDLMSNLIDDPDTDYAETMSGRDLIYDSELAIAAGSDTASATLASVIYLLAKHPDIQKQLQLDLDPVFNSAVNMTHNAIVRIPFLDAVINEAMRLYPPVPSGMQRETPPEGATIAGRFIPGDTLVTTPTWAIHRDPRNFPQPDSFIPSRWLPASSHSSSPNLILHKEAFFPFSAGAFSCAGKPLAMMELRMAVALVFRQFNVRLAGDDGGKDSVKVFESSPGWMDCFTAKIPPTGVVFEERV